MSKNKFQMGLKPGKCAEIIDEIQKCVFAELAEWL